MSICHRCGKRKDPLDAAWCRHCRRWLRWLAMTEAKERSIR
jgi:ribosomal protein L40E